jgi:hypothetical protein
MTIKDLERCFSDARANNVKYIGVKIKMQGFPKPEIIINENVNFDSKFSYYKKAYNDDLVLKSFSGIQIVGCDFSNSPSVIIKNLEDLN